MSPARSLLALAFCALLPACRGGDGAAITEVCPPVVLPSLRVEVVDAASGASLVAGASGTWTAGDASGEFYPSVTQTGGELIAYGPSGRYRVVVQHAGYRPWTRDDLVVPPAKGCAVTALRVRAALSPAG